ncbi:unnamed protein product [Allacma fusca]|uniref:Uncharacterized protein n=1 Tax=Allacma fusca TaxID=39272 RepID=A0A8J2JPU8_9HEXA|nr:unnamed protein product [Allacma fusca]
MKPIEGPQDRRDASGTSRGDTRSGNAWDTGPVRGDTRQQDRRDVSGNSRGDTRSENTWNPGPDEKTAGQAEAKEGLKADGILAGQAEMTESSKNFQVPATAAGKSVLGNHHQRRRVPLAPPSELKPARRIPVKRIIIRFRRTNRTRWI